MTVQIRFKSAHFLRIRRAGRTLRSSDFIGTAVRPAAAGDVVRRGAAGVSDGGGNAEKAASAASRRGICTFCRQRRLGKCERAGQRESRMAAQPTFAEKKQNRTNSALSVV